VDCPGYGYAKASQAEKEHWKKFMQVYMKESSSLQRVMLLVDLNVGL
jgi:GTP-binding protein